jgi:hypothetical protein
MSLSMIAKKKTLPRILLLWLLATLTLATPTHAQSDRQLKLRFSRDFGYSSGTGQIEGTFTLRASGPENLLRVEFLIDGEVINEDSEAPFQHQFNTGQFDLGIHTISARGYLQDGNVLQSSSYEREFVSPEEGIQTAGRILIPIFGLILAIMLLTFVIPLLFDRGKKSSLPLGVPRNYGIFGGAICPKCGRPFSRHIYGMNLVVGKLDRCPHCRKWSLVQRASLAELRAAEEAELESARGDLPRVEISEEERLRKELDDSRYQDL